MLEYSLLLFYKKDQDMWIAVIIIILLIIASLALVVYHDTHNFKVRNYEIVTDKVSGSYSFVFLSDLHSHEFGRNNQRLIDKIRELSPDAVLCAGDMFNARPVDGKVKTETAFRLMTALLQICPVYMSNGNHEEKIKELKKNFGNVFDRYKSGLVREGVIYLDNDSASFNEDIRVSGLCLDTSYFRKVVKKPMDPDLIAKKLFEVKGAEKDRFQILIAHNPQYFKEYAGWGADLTLSGHVHGGIVRLPLLGGVVSPSLALFPKYSGGRYQQAGRTMILSRGLGTHTINVRMFNPGEVSLIEIKGTKNVT